MNVLAENTPLVSVIVPTYNAERYIQSSLTSILQERRIPLEVIVVDDYSTDHSIQHALSLQDPRIRIVKNLEQGIAHALNTGIANARGDFIARCDADDLYPCDRLFQQVTWLDQHPDYVAVCGTYAAIDEQERALLTFDCGESSMEISEELQSGVTRTHLGTFTVRAEVLRQIGGFRSYFVTAEDIDLQLRLGENGRVWYCPTVSYLYRLHGSSVTHVQGTNERNFFNQMARDFQRQRQSQGKDALEQGIHPQTPNATDDLPLSANEHIQGLLLYRAWEEHQSGQRKAAIATGLRALALNPTDISVWKSVVSLMLKFLPKK